MKPEVRYSIVISVKAEREIIASWNWYETIQRGLGDRFVEAITQKVEKIAGNPLHYSKKIKEFREVSLKIVPFLIVYRINSQKKVVSIVSVFHTSRNPYKKIKA